MLIDTDIPDRLLQAIVKREKPTRPAWLDKNTPFPPWRKPECINLNSKHQYPQLQPPTLQMEYLTPTMLLLNNGAHWIPCFIYFTNAPSLQALILDSLPTSPATKTQIQNFLLEYSDLIDQTIEIHYFEHKHRT